MAKLGPFLAKPPGDKDGRPVGELRVGRAEDRVGQGWRVSLSRQYELAGKSGARYRYTSFEEERFLPPAGANFVIVWRSDTPASPPIVEGFHANLPAGRSIAFTTSARPIPPE